METLSQQAQWEYHTMAKPACQTHPVASEVPLFISNRLCMVGTRRLINMECTGCLQYTDKTSGEWVCPQATWVLLKMEARLDNSLDMAKHHLMLVL